MRKTTGSLVVALLVIAAAVFGCSKAAVTPTVVPSPVTATISSVRIVPDMTAIKVGAVAQFSFAVTMSAGLPPTVPPPLWSTSDGAVAQVDPGGRVTGVSPGTMTLSIAFVGLRDSRVLQVVP